jgi:hypothetical protein
MDILMLTCHLTVLLAVSFPTPLSSLLEHFLRAGMDESGLPLTTSLNFLPPLSPSPRRVTLFTSIPPSLAPSPSPSPSLSPSLSPSPSPSPRSLNQSFSPSLSLSPTISYVPERVNVKVVAPREMEVFGLKCVTMENCSRNWTQHGGH